MAPYPSLVPHGAAVVSVVSFRATRRRVLAGMGVMFLTSWGTPGWGSTQSAVPAGIRRPDERSGQAPLRRDARIVVLDWGLTEIVLSLGVVPAGVSRPVWYTRLDGDPPIPSSVTDTGLLFQPNFEVLEELKPDLIVITPWHAPLRALLERIAPTFTVAMYGPGVDIYPAVRAAASKLGARLDRQHEADALLQQADARIAAAGEIASASASAATGRPVYLLRPLDDRHVSVAGPHSLFGGVLRELGFVNAWQGATDPLGMAETDLAALAHEPEAQAVMVGMPPAVAASLARGPLWQALPFVKQQRVRQVAMIPPAGGLVAAMRFADSFAAALRAST